MPRQSRIPRTVWSTDCCLVIRPALVGYRWTLYDTDPMSPANARWMSRKQGTQRFRGWAPSYGIAIHAAQAYVNRRKRHHIVYVTAHSRTSDVLHDSKNIG
jgi:hypothetical protein